MAKPSLFEIARQRAEQLFQIPEEGLPGRKRLLRLGKLSYLTLRELGRNLCLERAASLSFTTTISFIPLGILILFLFGASSHSNDLVEEAKSWIVEDFVAKAKPGESEIDSPQAAGDPSHEVRDWLDKVHAQLKAPLEQESTWVQAVALCVLLFTVSSLFRSAERNFSVIWNVERDRGFLQKLGTYWLLLTAPVIILVLAVLLKKALFGDSTDADGLASFGFGTAISFFAFTLIYVYLPNTRVHADAAAIGALIAAIGWETGTKAFGLYIQTAVLGSVYGALGVIPFFLAFVYFSWFVALAGAQISYCIQNYSVLEREVRYHLEANRLARPVHALLVMERVYRAFEGPDEAPVTANSVATEFGLPLTMIEDIVEKLRDGGYLATARGDVLSPSRSPERVTLLEIVEVYPSGTGFDLSSWDGPSSPLQQHLATLSGDLSTGLREATFATSHRAPAPPLDPTPVQGS